MTNGRGGRYLAAIVTVTCVAILVILLRLNATDRFVGGDTFWYSRQAAAFSGSSTAVQDAARFMAERRGDDPAAWERIAVEIDPRYPAIFAARPLYPLLAAPLTEPLGLAALQVVSVIAGIACAAAVAASTIGWSGSLLAGVIAGAAAVILPSGDWFVFMYADGLMLALWASCLLAAGQFVRERRAGWLAVFIFLLSGLFVTKSANGTVMALALTAVAALGMFRAGLRDPLVGLAVAAWGVTVSYLAVSALLGYSGLAESLQDLATQHFRIPDVANPVGELLVRDGALISSVPAMVLDAPLSVIIAAVGLAILLVVGKTLGVLWLIAGVSCVVLVLLHPLPSEIPRLMAPVWLSVSVGLASAGRVALFAARRRLGTGRVRGVSTDGEQSATLSR